MLGQDPCHQHFLENYVVDAIHNRKSVTTSNQTSYMIQITTMNVSGIIPKDYKVLVPIFQNSE